MTFDAGGALLPMPRESLTQFFPFSRSIDSVSQVPPVLMVEEERQELVSLQKCLEGIESNDEQSASDDQVDPVRHWKLGSSVSGGRVEYLCSTWRSHGLSMPVICSAVLFFRRRKWMKWIAVTSMAFGSLYGLGKCYHQRLVKGRAIDDVTGLYEMPPGRLTDSCCLGICIFDIC